MTTRYDSIKQGIDDFDALALLLSNTARRVGDACPQKFCQFRAAGICERCPSGWRWALREVTGEEHEAWHTVYKSKTVTRGKTYTLPKN